MKTIISLLLICMAALLGCTEADIASQFQIERRIIFYNDKTGENMLCIEGLCSIGYHNKANDVSITCKTGKNTYKKHFLSLSNNITFFVEQIREAPADIYPYKVTFRPEAFVPDVNLEISR